MDRIDISELPDDTKIIATVKELKNLYAHGWSAGHHNFDIEDGYQTIKGDIV